MNVVVDTNILAYYWLPGQRTEEAVALRRSTDDWYAPKLWKSELRNILAGYLRRGGIGPDAARVLIRAAGGSLQGSPGSAGFQPLRRPDCRLRAGGAYCGP